MGSKRGSAWADLGMLAAILLGATVVVAVIAAGALLTTPEGERGPLMFAVYSAQFALAIVGGVIWLRRAGGGKRGGDGGDGGGGFSLRLGISWADGPLILAGIVVATAAGVVIEPLLATMPEHYLEQLDAAIGRGGWAIAMTVVAAPVLEEIFFRGMVLESLARRWAARWAVLGSAALFGLVHLPILPQMVNAFVVAIVMGYLYLMTRSLVPVIAIHAINNGLAYMILELYGSQGVYTRDLIADDTIYWIVYAVSAAVTIAALIVMDARVRTKTTRNTLNEKTADE